jgi:hypothetical protein
MPQALILAAALALPGCAYPGALSPTPAFAYLLALTIAMSARRSPA